MIYTAMSENALELSSKKNGVKGTLTFGYNLF